ncbi:MAG TPA: MarR family transcriptional regulator [archaeon]|nr:MarR family transcriptional regulator [archaeon]
MEQLKEGGFLISKIHQLGGRIFAKLLKIFNINELNPAQGRIMFPLWRQQNLSFQELLEKTSLSKSTLSKMVDNLEKMGFIKRIRDEDDKRTILIQLSKDSKNYQERYIEVSNEMTKIFYYNFTKQEVNTFENYLLRILENLKLYNVKKSADYLKN